MKKRVFYLTFVLIVAMLPAVAQTQDAAKTDSNPQASAAPTNTNKPAEEKKPKKVWTNEEMGGLKGSVSVVGDKSSTTKQMADQESNASGQTGSRQERVRQYRDAIAELNRKIAEADARIAQFKDFKGENASPSGGVNPSKKYTMLPPEEQVKQLETRKKDLQAKIDDLEVQAAKEGIDPGELR